ncbi:MAG: UvrD-helicase domain-containing protein [Bacteroidales bacterium]|nr:UvrD-helicase domain-containing protein [Bacteroidales bacterium]
MLNIYKASAGSGKTHTLTKDFIFLSFNEPSRFMSILAVTFTNKAAGEMKERIISELAILSTKPLKSAFFDDIKNHFKLTESQISNKARKNLTKILHNYTFFNISTIDSFVQKVIRAFAFELQIPNSYALELDSEKVATELTDELILGLDENENLQKWLIQYANEKISEGKNWDFRDSIMNFSKQLFKEDFYNIFDELNISDEEFSSKMNEILKICYSLINLYEKDFNALIEKGVKIIEKSGINNVKGQKINYLCNFFLKNSDYSVILNNTLQKAFDEDDWWSKSTKEDLKSQWRNTLDALSAVLEELINLEQTKGKEYFSALNIKTNIFNFGVLNNLSNLLPEYREKNNSLLISDITLLLKKIIGNNEAPFVYEKIGNKFKNIMIDEFQDTSGFQWHNFKPLILNSLAFDYYNLIVGDVKQSIYRWRSGDWRLLHSKIKEEIGKSYISEVTLDTNWRSKKEIVQFNNAVFQVLPKILKQKIVADNVLNAEFTEMTNVITEAYKDTVQKIAPKHNTGGFVKIQFYNNVEWKETVDQEIICLLTQLLEKYSPGDIGILVRTNGDANRIMKLLLKHISELTDDKKFNVISAESLLLSNSLAIKILIDVLKFIVMPENYILLIEIILHNNRLQKLPVDDKLFFIKNLDEAKDFLPEEFIEQFNNFIHLSLFELVEKLLIIFNLNNFETEIPFIRSFQEIISDYINNAGSDIAGFLNFWDNNSHKLSVQLSDQKNAVQIMTVHKSKGLAFGVVIMPYIDWNLNPKASTVLWANTTNTPFNQFPFLPINYNSDLSKSNFQQNYIEETIYSYMDNLNMLYVSFTRAKERIYAFAKSSKSNTNNSISDNLLNTFVDYGKYENNNISLKLNNYWDKLYSVFQIGDENIVYCEAKIGEFKNFVSNSYPSNDWTKNIAIIAHAEDLIAETVEVRRNAMKYGIMMHGILSSLVTKNDVNKIVDDMKLVGKITDSDAQDIIKLIIELFENEQFAEWFNPKWEVFSEKEILTKYGATKIPDRVIANDSEIIVIDYKFGSERPEHKKQIKEYVYLLKDIYQDKKVSGFLLYAEEKLIKEVEI